MPPRVVVSEALLGGHIWVDARLSDGVAGPLPDYASV